MHKKANIRYRESYLPTPRHRIERLRLINEEIKVELREVTGEQAPVAFRMTDPRGFHLRIEYGKKVGRNVVVEYRWFEQQLYCLCRRRCFRCVRDNERNIVAPVSDLDFSPCSCYDSRQQAVDAVEATANEYLLIDGVLHKRIGEPRYCIYTLGLGGNHGLGYGTNIGVEHWYNSNIPNERYFRIDEEEKMRETGWKIAQRRGDTKAKPQFDKRRYERFEILIPEAVRLNPMVEHGDGDEFMRQCEAITCSGLPPVIAGALLTASLPLACGFKPL
jgi:hypothetical protein